MADLSKEQLSGVLSLGLWGLNADSNESDLPVQVVVAMVGVGNSSLMLVHAAKLWLLVGFGAVTDVKMARPTALDRTSSRERTSRPSRAGPSTFASSMWVLDID